MFFKEFSISDLDIYIRKLEYWKIILIIIILAGIYYYGYTKLSDIKGQIDYKNATYLTYKTKAKKKYKVIEKLSRFKSNTIFLMSKLQTLNTIRNILTKRNFKYVLDIQQQSIIRSSGMININNLTANSVKMGIYRYIPIKILVKNYIDFRNLLGTIKLLQQSNFILTGVSSITSRNVNNIVLIGKLYVK